MSSQPHPDHATAALLAHPGAKAWGEHPTPQHVWDAARRDALGEAITHIEALRVRGDSGDLALAVDALRGLRDATSQP